MVAGLLDQVSLGGLQLTNPTLVYGAGTNSVTAVGTVSIPTNYPPKFDSPTNIEMRVRSSGLERFDVQGRTGPFVAELTVDLSYDSAPLERVLKAATAGDLGAAATRLGDIERHARFGMSGTAGVGWPGHKLPLTYLRGRGSVDPSGVTVRGGAAGVIGLPKGTFHPELAVPAVGAAVGAASVKPQRGRTSRPYTAGYGFAGVTGTPSIQNLVTGDLAGAFAPFAYAQVVASRRTADGHQFSIKISAQYQLGSAGKVGSPVEQYRSGLDARRQAERHDDARAQGDPKRAGIDPAIRSQWDDFSKGPVGGTGAEVVVTGTFDLLGGR